MKISIISKAVYYVRERLAFRLVLGSARIVINEKRMEHVKLGGEMRKMYCSLCHKRAERNKTLLNILKLQLLRSVHLANAELQGHRLTEYVFKSCSFHYVRYYLQR